MKKNYLQNRKLSVVFVVSSGLGLAGFAFGIARLMSLRIKDCAQVTAGK